MNTDLLPRALPDKLPPKKRANGSANKLSASDRPAHDWYRFVLSFPPHLVRDYCERFELGPHTRLLDPFCGTGTTLVEAKKLGIPSVGIEAHPMAFFASQVKTDWAGDAELLVRHASSLADVANERLAQFGIPHQTEMALESRAYHYGLMSLAPEVKSLLLTGSISPLPLHRTLTLLQVMDSLPNDAVARYERLALAKALVTRIGNLSFGPEVGVGQAKVDSPVVAEWLVAVKNIADDLEVLKSRSQTKSIVHHGDSRSEISSIAPLSIDAVITSPPYPNEKDYTRTTRLESVLLGFLRSKEELQALKRNMLRSNTRGVYKLDDDDKWVDDHEEIRRIAEAIEARRIALGKNSGFERLYARVTRLYFGGMFRHLSDLRSVLRPNAMLAYVVGDQASYLQVMIRTGQILADLASRLGYEVESIDLFRTRLATTTKEQLREEVVVLRWPGSS